MAETGKICNMDKIGALNTHLFKEENVDQVEQVPCWIRKQMPAIRINVYRDPYVREIHSNFVGAIYRVVHKKRPP